MHSKVTGCALVLALLFAVPIGAEAQQQSSDTPKEFWPAVRVYVPLKEKIRLYFLFTTTRSEETKNDQEAHVGAHVDYTVNKWLVLSAGYRYGFSFTDDDPFKEHRPLTEQTIRQALPLGILLTDRNREEFRFVNGDYSFRYRNRLRFEREFPVRDRSISPYASIELYHDSRFDVWNRNRLTVGTQVQLKRAFALLRSVIPRKQLLLDVYYTKQNDSRSEPHHIHAIGTALVIHF